MVASNVNFDSLAIRFAEGEYRLIFTEPVRLIPIPWIELPRHTEDLLPAVATGLQLDLGLVFIGMVLPFWAVIGGLVGLTLYTLWQFVS